MCPVGVAGGTVISSTPSRVSNVDLGAEHGLGDGDVEIGVEIDALTAEHVVGADPELHVQVAGRSTTGTDRAPALEPQGGAGVDAGRDVDGVGLVLEPPALAGALRARILDDLARSAAAGTGAGGDHLAEQRLADLAHLTRTSALDAGDRLRSRRRAGGFAGLAGHGGAHLDLVLGAEDGFGEVEIGDHLEIGPAGWPAGAAAPAPEGTLTAEEGVEDVADAATEAERVAAAALPLPASPNRS